MDYWNDIITEKSWNVLKELNKKIKFTLIGGWAAYLWSHSHKSKDIDIVVEFGELEKIKKAYKLKKNDNLRKYEITIDEIDVDIYVPYYSRLAVPAEDIRKYAEKIENFNVVKPEILLILKQAAEYDRQESEKGLKDRIDIMGILLNCDIDSALYKEKLKEYRLMHYKSRLIEIVNTFRDLKYLTLNPREFKVKKREILNRLKKGP